MPIREIERRTGLSRNTIRKYLRGGSVRVRRKPRSGDGIAKHSARQLQAAPRAFELPHTFNPANCCQDVHGLDFADRQMADRTAHQ